MAQAVAALPAAADELARALRSASRNAAERAGDRLHAALDEPVAPAQGAGSLFTGVQRDVRYALRAFLRAPGFTFVVVLTLALGTGATAVIFSAVDALLLRDPPVAQPDRLVSVYTRFAARTTTNPNAGDQVGNSSYPDYVDLRDSGVLEGLAAFAGVALALDANGVVERIDGEIVSGNYFDVLGVRPTVGRTFAADEDRIGSPVRVVVLSYRSWQQRFAGDAGLVGRTITLNGQPYTVIGVAPRGLSGVELGDAPEAWVPMALQEEVRPPSAGLRRTLGGANLLDARGPRWLDLVGRLRAGHNAADAAAALDVIGRRLAAAYPETNRDLSATAVPLGEGPGVRTEARPLLALLGAAVGAVLLIACANVSSLLLARAVMRRREVAVRLAIGASRAQLVRQWLTEAVMLGAAGALGGVVIARWTVPVLYGLGIPASIDLGVNWQVLAFTITVGIVTGLVFGVAPAIQVVRRDTIAALRDEGGSVAASARSARLRSAFVVIQVALSLVLLVGAGLFIRTLQHAYAVDLGYEVNRVLVGEINLDVRGYTQEAGRGFYVELLDRLNALPGVHEAGAARVTVLSGNARTVGVSVDRQPIRQDRSNALPVRANVVSDRYFAAMGIPLIRGRTFESLDGPEAPRVAVISRSLAERLWPGADPIGRLLVFSGGAPAQVVGVVRDAVYLSATERDPRPVFYLPLSQHYESGVALHIRTHGDPLAIVPVVRQTIRDLDPQLVLARPRRLVDEFARSVGDQRTMAMLVGLFSGVALVLAAIGLYGVMAYVARQRTAEVGLRLALGATPGSILSLMVSRGARLVVIGLVIGAAGAAVGTRFVQNRLFGIERTDPVTWLAVIAALTVVGLAACAIPAWRASRTDPTAALRSV